MIQEPELREITRHLEERHALVVPETNKSRLSEFVAQRLREHSWTMDAYFMQLAMNISETALLLDAATIGETYFFRDESHFSLLLEEFLPFFSRLGRVPRAWSAATSTGEEALSIAVVYAQFFGSLEKLGGEIWASDINAISLDFLRGGTYRNRSLRDDGRRFHASLEPWITREEQLFKVDPRLRSLLEIRTINLMSDSFDAIPGQVDILFLKNMMIYFPLDRRKSIYRKLSSKLSPEGILVLGKSEVPFFESPDMALIERRGTFFCVPKTSSFPAFAKRLP
ncbi:MAG: CheR family methyltransferase [Spirochaetota bacterium]